MKRFVISPEAGQDIRDIRAYLKREAGALIAQSTVNKIKEACLFLSRTPGAGHSREDLTSAAVKFWPVFSYLIIYDPATQPIEIVRVIHGNRELLAILERTDD